MTIVRRTSENTEKYRAILDALRDAGRPLTAKAIGARTGLSTRAVVLLLGTLLKSGHAAYAKAPTENSPATYQPGPQQDRGPGLPTVADLMQLVADEGRPLSAIELGQQTGHAPRTIARIIGYGIKRGECHIAIRRYNAQANPTAYYAPGATNAAQAEPQLPEQAPGYVTEQHIGPGHRRIRFGTDWKPTPAQTNRIDVAGVQSGFSGAW